MAPSEQIYCYVASRSQSFFQDNSFGYLDGSVNGLLGGIDDVGVIEIAVFRERAAEPVQISDSPTASGSTEANPGSAPAAHGERERSQSEPNEIVRIHYDSLERLIAMGIIARPPG